VREEADENAGGNMEEVAGRIDVKSCQSLAAPFSKALQHRWY
jgi:hypothetical protein